jgi:hypothetical protein
LPWLSEAEEIPHLAIMFKFQTAERGKSLKILVIGMADSVHLSRWLSQFKDSEHEFRIVSSSPHRKIHQQLKDLLRTPKFSMSLFSRVMSLPLWLGDRVFSNWLRGILVAFEASVYRPDLVHVLEFQNAGYVFLRAEKLNRALRQTKLLLTPYGSDIFWFQRFPGHLARIQRLLERADAMSCECHRDELLATKYGFQGKFMPRIPAFGGVRVNAPSDDRSSRQTIAVKGYQYSLGQALIALEALELIAREIEDYEIVLYSCNRKTIQAAKNLQARSSLTISCFPKFALSNAEVCDLFARSNIFIGLSKSDGISASMIEAMANGAIPIQSDTSCGSEWMENGVGGYLVDYADVSKISELVLSVLRDEAFQASAAQANFERLSKLLRPEIITGAARATYAEIY